ncbi:uncharacterized protein LOC104582496 isoform X2 [Brachypodium distachyon]|uniref:uncharacterized protein LOC104582496 isoform X2 n=1 Tax=Brachypodium distachyon TaxID=15368 RepID=UPI000D0CC77A|nr:uncharacterized protein LOC104582496 isoform X2 [Brachypodium distachyon]|eukprot:XP_024314713.1 uncharacterized protein LOC104582496 isoform X2 [Brachypodium distachyon]
MEIRAQVAAEETDEARRKCRKVGEIMGSSLEVLSDQSHDAEPAVILGTDAACGLLAKMPPLTSMQDEPTNAERAATLDASAAWERLGMPPLTLSLEQCRQLLTTASYETLENLWSRETLENLQSEKAPENPLEKFQHANNLVMQAHERKRLEGLIDSYRKLIDSYRKLYLNQSPAQGTSESPALVQPIQSSSAAQTTTALPTALSSAIRPPAQTLPHPPGPYVELQSIFPGNLHRATSPLSIPACHGGHGAAVSETPATLSVAPPVDALKNSFCHCCLTVGHSGSFCAALRVVSGVTGMGILLWDVILCYLVSQVFGGRKIPLTRPSPPSLQNHSHLR